MRIALADAGDAMDDANFEHQTANGAILRLTKEVCRLHLHVTYNFASPVGCIMILSKHTSNNPLVEKPSL